MTTQQSNSIVGRFNGEFGIEHPHGIHLYVPNNQVIACPTVHQVKGKFVTKLLLSVMETNIYNRIYNRLFDMTENEHNVVADVKDRDVNYFLSLLSNPYKTVTTENEAVEEVKRLCQHISVARIPQNYYDIVDYDVKDVLEDITFENDDFSVDWSSLGKDVYIISLYYNDYSPAHLVRSDEDEPFVERFAEVSLDFKNRLEALEEFKVTPVKLVHDQIYILQRK